jgi:hypothetical protein
MLKPSDRMSWFTCLACAAFGWLGSVDFSHSSADPSGLCLEAAAFAASESGVPYNVLLAITLVETGRAAGEQLKPWPWAVNQGGDGNWFQSEAEAQAYVQSALDQGVTNIDVGCFQLNHRWHAENFPSLQEMLDPAQNGLYAARLLARLQAETGDWSSAAAAYHSRTPEYAERYRAKFEGVMAQLGDATPGLASAPRLAAAEPEERPNLFPLLVRGPAGSGGSLVPATEGRTRLIGAP